ncbi:PhoU domain-containing protein [Salsipaludibacter albus]|uniref:PhoU domain-containing protein n=1 Tax=Salsipaludibacter albus TaxID=2849650 RepID=UPI001EE49054|nr:PhoU domain-containing protein [Salsipaludibacter albus]MBY5161878.1 PhoU domain-containing protein [Salsipaludibacter albus]
MHLFGSRGDADGLDTVEAQLSAMLADDATSLGLARAALFEGASVGEVRPRLKETDQRVNAGEQEVRRALVVHIAVAGAADSPALLTYMSIVKDVERIGDYAKNLMDLARMGVDFSRVEDRADLLGVYDAAAAVVPDAAEAFAARDAAGARTVLARCEELLAVCNRAVEAAAASDRPGHVEVPRALLHRYLKRVVAHSTNLLSAVLMPVDRLDYFDEDEREPDVDPA